MSNLHRMTWSAVLLAGILFLSGTASAADIEYLRFAESPTGYFGIATNSSGATFSISATDAEIIVAFVQTRTSSAVNESVTSVTFAGQPMTAVPNGDIENTSGNVRTQMFYYINSAISGYTGTQTVSITLANSASYAKYGAMAFRYLDKANPFQECESAAGQVNDETALTVDLNTATDGSMVFMSGVINDDGNINPIPVWDPANPDYQGNPEWDPEVSGQMRAEGWWAPIPDSTNQQVTGYIRDGGGSTGTFRQGVVMGGSMRPDVAGPAVTLSSTSDTYVSGPITVNVTLSEESEDFASGDITATNAVVSGFTRASGSWTSYSFTLTPTSQGTFSARVNAGRCEDYAGNNNTQSNTLSRTFDSTPPAPAASGAIVRADASPTNALTVNWTVTFTESVTGVDAGDFTLDPTVTGASIASVTGSGSTRNVAVNTGSGSGSLRLNLVDNDTILDVAGNPLGGTGAGNGNAAGEAYIIDKEPPTSCSVTINGGDAATNNEEVLLTLTATDDQAVSMRIRNDSLAWSPWQAFSSTLQHWLPTGDGPHTVYAEFRDSLGNTIATPVSDDIVLDTVLPTGTFFINGDDPATGSLDVTLDITADPDLTGVPLMQVSDNGVDWSAAAAFNPAYPYTLPGGEGTKTVYVRLIDGAGNTGAAMPDDIEVDQTGPGPESASVLVNGDAEYTTSVDVTLTLDALDPNGVAFMSFSNNGVDYSAEVPYATTYPWTLEGADGLKTVYAKFKDGLGNEGAAVTDEITLDTTNPSGTIVVNDDDEATGSRTVAVTVTPDGGDLYEVRLSSDGTTWGPWEEFAGLPLSFQLTETEGSQDVFAELKDSAGNTSQGAISDSIILDQSPPDGSIVIEGGAPAINSQDVMLTLFATDTYTDVAQMRFSNDGSAWSQWEAYGTSKSWLLEAGDGVKTVYVEYQDEVGNVNTAEISDTIELDTVAPPPPAVTGPTPTNDPTPTWSWTPGETPGLDTAWRFKLDDGPWSEPTTDNSYTPPEDLPDGEHTVCVQERDTAGNWSEEFCYTILIDTQAPNPPAVDAPLLTKNPQPTWSWLSGGNGGNGTYRIQLDSEAEKAWTTTTALTFTPADPGFGDDETHTLYVQEQDDAGNWSTSGSATVAIDYDAITEPNVTGVTPTNDTTPEWTWTSGGGLGHYRYQLDSESGAWIETDDTAWSPSTPVPADGPYTLYVQEQRSVANWSPSGSFTITVDTAAPSAPIVDDLGETNNTQPTFTWTSGCETGNGVFRYLFDCETSQDDWTETTEFSVAPDAPLSEGVHTLCVQERDEAGNWSETGAGTVTIDTTPPGAPDVTGPAVTPSQKPTWTWTSGGGGNGQYRYQLDSVAGDWTATTAQSFAPADDLPVGPHTLFVQERDNAGNWSASGSAIVDVQPTPPGAPVVSSPAITTNPTPEWTWTGSATGTFRYQLDSESGDGWIETADTSFTPGTPLADGLHTLYVQEQSGAGVWSDSGSSSTFVDTTPPNAPVVTAPLTTGDATPTWSWTSGGGGNGVFRYQLGGTAGDWAETSETSFTPEEDLADGSYTLYVQERDDAGNWSAAGTRTVQISQTGGAAPVVSGPEATQNRRPAWTWVSGGAGNGRFRYQLNGEDGQWTLTSDRMFRPIDDLEDGFYTLYVQEQNFLGNWSASGSWTILVDNVPPIPPVVTGVTPTRNTRPTWSWVSGGDGAGVFRYQLNGEGEYDWTVSQALSYAPDFDLEKNAYTLYVQEQDAAGNWSVSTLYVIVIDPNAVQSPIVTGVPQTNNTTPTWTWESGGGGEGRYRYRLDGGAWVITYDTAFSAGADLAQGSHTLEVQESNEFGDWSWPGSFTTTITLGLPTITILGDNPVQVAAGTEYADDGATAADAEGADITGDIVTTGLPVDTSVTGTYYVRYNVTDGAGNRAPEAVRTVEVVSGVTEVALTSPATGSTLYMAAAGMPVLLALTSVAPEGTASVTYTFDDVEVGTATAAPWLVIVEITPDAAVFGEHTIGVAAVDAAKDSADSVTLTIAEIPEGSDLDANNIPDNPFTTLGPGDLWALDGVIVLREDAAATVPAGAPNMLALANPYNTVQRLIAAVSPSVLGTGETGVVILKASNSLETLLGAGEAALVADPPLGYAVAGSFYGTVNIAVTNNMVDYWNLDSSVLADFPVVVTTQDSLEVDIDLLVHEAEVMSGAEGVFIGIPTGAAWGNAGVVELNVVDGDATATLKALGLVAAFEVEGGEGEGEGEGEPPACFAANLQPPAPPTSGDGMLLMLVAALLLLAVKMRPRTARSIR